MSSATHPIDLTSDIEMEDAMSSASTPMAPALIAPVSSETEPFEEGEVVVTPPALTIPEHLPVFGPPTYDRYLESQQWLSPSDIVSQTPSHADSVSSTSRPSPLPVRRRRRRARVLKPYEPAPFGQPFRYRKDGATFIHTARKRVRAPITFVPPSDIPSSSTFPPSAAPIPPPIHASPLPPPSTFIYQTTIVPVSSPPCASSPLVMHTEPVISLRERVHFSPVHSDPYHHVVFGTSEPGAHRRVDARRWSFIMPVISRWRSEEGAPSTMELGEHLFAAAETLPVTGEPLHHTIPLLAARVLRAEDQLEDVVAFVDEVPLVRIENIEDEVGELLNGRTTMERVLDRIGAQSERASGAVTVLERRTESDRLGLLDRAEMLEGVVRRQSERMMIMETRATALEQRLEARDREVDDLAELVRDLQRRVRGTPDSL